MKVTIDIPKKYFKRASLVVTAIDDIEEVSDETIKEFLDSEHFYLDQNDLGDDEDSKNFCIAIAMLVLAKFIKEHEKD